MNCHKPVLRSVASAILSFLLCISLTTPARAAGINTNVALPVREGGVVFRTQVRFLTATGDPTPMDRDIDIYSIPNVFVYGATPNTTLFGVLPFFSQSIESTSSGTRVEDEVDGFGDFRFLLRQTVYARDAVQRTSRFAVLGGLEIPSGKEEFSSHSTDFLLGGVYTLQAGRQEIDADLIYRVNTEGRGFELGDQLIYNVAYQLRISPWRWPERGTPSQAYLVLEANGSSSRRALDNGVMVGDSGGNVLFLSPGIQWISKRLIYEASLQIPVVQNLNGSQVEVDYAAAAGIRVQF